MVPHLGPVPAFGWAKGMEPSGSRKRIYPPDAEYAHSTKSVEHAGTSR
jgi:hypothetical protein